MGSSQSEREASWELVAHLSSLRLIISSPIFGTLCQRSQLFVAILDNTACAMVNGENSRSIGGGEPGRFWKNLYERYVPSLLACQDN